MDRILVIEDDATVQKALRRTFESAGFEVVVAPDGATAVQTFQATSPRAVLLDLRLPGKSGQDICREIRGFSPNVPILVLSAASDVVDKVLLLELGADDYVTKPFSPRELLARVRTALRRLIPSIDKQEVYNFDEIQVDFGKMELLRSGQPVALTPQEFKMLRFFLNNKDRVVSRNELLNEVWGYHSYPTTRTVDTHILRLRQKLERDPADPIHFRTVHGTGYKFVE
ncbi:two component transcriptional regulator, winged helix family [Candidatus Koribacter versatilis Ellin345]|uniref:Phosphate regulon transcriptional regulatory protein PhoB n=1 Tax=Koribacter versatilis (strain Ellin345) TaxID=204669 RepID=Q1IJ96_KORVE|nr:response regulator transcription factor [Candidatus Koribacter versatilis]ABF43054.1 two component transcriptional regulator, winged helix family [Candidatus Koribacter versatilis Ellin345]